MIMYTHIIASNYHQLLELHVNMYTHMNTHKNILMHINYTQASADLVCKNLIKMNFKLLVSLRSNTSICQVLNTNNYTSLVAHHTPPTQHRLNTQLFTSLEKKTPTTEFFF